MFLAHFTLCHTGSLRSTDRVALRLLLGIEILIWWCFTGPLARHLLVVDFARREASLLGIGDILIAGIAELTLKLYGQPGLLLSLGGVAAILEALPWVQVADARVTDARGETVGLMNLVTRRREAEKERESKRCGNIVGNEAKQKWPLVREMSLSMKPPKLWHLAEVNHPCGCAESHREAVRNIQAPNSPHIPPQPCALAWESLSSSRSWPQSQIQDGWLIEATYPPRIPLYPITQTSGHSHRTPPDGVRGGKNQYGLTFILTHAWIFIANASRSAAAVANMDTHSLSGAKQRRQPLLMPIVSLPSIALFFSKSLHMPHTRGGPNLLNLQVRNSTDLIHRSLGKKVSQERRSPHTLNHSPFYTALWHLPTEWHESPPQASPAVSLMLSS